MSQEEENIEIVRQLFKSFTAGDFDSFYARFTDDTITIEADSLPYGGTFRGPEAARKAFAEMSASWVDPHVHLRAITAGGEYVVGILDFSGTGAKTGKRISLTIAEIWQMRDGKVVLVNPIYSDTVSACDALGSGLINRV